MLLKPLFTLLIICPHQFCATNPLLNVYFINHLIMIFFYVLSDVYVFPLRPYNAHKLDYCSTPCVFLGYSSSHLGYRCLDLSSKRLYISCHVRFNEHLFPFLEYAHISPPTTHTYSPTTITHLPSLTIFPSTTPSDPPPASSNPVVPLSPSTFISVDHCAGIGSTTSMLSITASPLANVSPA